MHRSPIWLHAFDMLVIDHPSIGEAAQQNLLARARRIFSLPSS